MKNILEKFAVLQEKKKIMSLKCLFYTTYIYVTYFYF